jgi:hypothetical protein
MWCPIEILLVGWDGLVVRLAGDCPADSRDAVAALQLAAVHGEDGDDAAGSLVDAVGDPLGRNVVAFAVI